MASQLWVSMHISTHMYIGVHTHLNIHTYMWMHTSFIFSLLGACSLSLSGKPVKHRFRKNERISNRTYTGASRVFSHEVSGPAHRMCKRALISVLVKLKSFVVDCFLLFGGLPTSSQINLTQSLILAY